MEQKTITKENKMRMLNSQELCFVSGGTADFSGVTATVTSTEEIVDPQADCGRICKALQTIFEVIS
jgi:hypothetical protein